MIKGPKAEEIKQVLLSASAVYVASIAHVEAAMVMMGRMGWDRPVFDRDWQGLALQEVPVDAALSKLAIDAFERWGRGRGRAALNFGDCFSYALAASRNIPLLFVGDDFASTDVERAGPL
mgnify:FL=1